VPKSSSVHLSQDRFITRYVKTGKIIRAIARSRVTFPRSFNHKEWGVKNQFERRIIRGARYWLPVLICQSAEAGLCDRARRRREMRELYFSTVLERFALPELSPSVKWTVCGKRSWTSTEEKLLKEPVILIAAACTWISITISARRSERAKKVCFGQLLQKEGNMMVKQHVLFTLYSICGIILKGKSASNFKQPMQCIAIWGGSSSLAYAPCRKGIMLWNDNDDDDLYFHNISKALRVNAGTVSR